MAVHGSFNTILYKKPQTPLQEQYYTSLKYNRLNEPTAPRVNKTQAHDVQSITDYCNLNVTLQANETRTEYLQVSCHSNT